jgi:hypothetical protein
MKMHESYVSLSSVSMHTYLACWFQDVTHVIFGFLAELIQDCTTSIHEINKRKSIYLL